jgi:hypothetical protein
MSYLIAVTTSDGLHIEGHFGHAASFLIIEVDEGSGRWHSCGFRSLPGEATAAGEAETGTMLTPRHDDVCFERVACLLADTSYLLTERIGPKPHRLLLQKDIAALEVSGSIGEAIAHLNAYHKRSGARR